MIGEVRLLTWNVNGLRACVQRLKKKNLTELLDALDADILCFQETKMTRAELDEELARPQGYDAFYSFSKARSGYSGVVTYCRSGVVPTIAAEEGLTGMWPVDDAVGHVGNKHLELTAKTLNELESEGRCVITDHQAFVLLNVYCPAVRNSERLEYKLAFHELLLDRVQALQKAGKRVIVVGDINVSHREIDHCDPEPYGEGTFGDHPCRQWMDRFVISSLPKPDDETRDPDDHRLVDSFRHFHPDQTKAFTCWSMVTAARQTNYGTRIDYVLMDRELVDESATSCSVESHQMGSDHCPVLSKLIVQFDLSGYEEGKTASLCAKYFAEFAGKQQTLTSFLTQSVEREAAEPLHVPTSQSIHSLVSNQTKRKSKTTNGSAQRSITSFFGQPSLRTTTSTHGSTQRQTTEVDKLPSSSTDESIDVAVWTSFLGSKRRLEEEEQNKWKQVLSGQPPKTPLCYCGEPTVLRTVLKRNENWGRKFYVCTRPEGEKGHPDARCEFFKWVEPKNSKKPKPS